jgi:hypothetical protein
MYSICVMYIAHSLKRVFLVISGYSDTINLRVKRRTFAMGLNSEPRKSENRGFPWPKFFKARIL